MSNLIGVAAENIEVKNEGGTSTLLAPGLHPAVITNVEEGVTENGNPYVDYYFAINGGVNQGETLRSREWPQSKSEVGQEIYNKKLKSLLTICNVQGALQSLEQFHGIQMLINNKPRKREDTGEMQNNINYYRSYDPAAKLAVNVPQGIPAPAAPAPVMPAPVAVQPAPVQVAAPAPIPAPAPVQAVQPAQVQPVQPAPVQPAPVQAAPVQPVQPQAAPVQPQAVQAAPVQPAQPAAVFAVNPVQAVQPAQPDVGDGDNIPY